MLQTYLDGTWQMRREDETDWIPVTVPSSVTNDLLLNKRIEDPFFRDNEDIAREISDYNYI